MFSQFITFVLVVCAVIITILVIRREFNPKESTLTTFIPIERPIENWKEIVKSNVELSSAPVQILKFYDYQCPWCKSVQPAINTVLHNYSEKISVQYIHFPLRIHAFAYEAAIAVECAKNQNGFESYHSLLFEGQEFLGELSYVDIAQDAGILDIPTFVNCVKNEETAHIVNEGLDLAKQLNVNSIPTFLINGTLISGALSEEQLDDYIKKEIIAFEKEYLNN